MVRTPVALVIFNRPNTTARVFAQIARAKPSRLFVIADGPRVDREGEAELCAAAREITEHVDWDCEVFRSYAERNMGNHQRIPSGITWAFEHTEELIVLEDDCVPHPTFFRFCDELLERYRHDTRVMHIAGNHLQPRTRRAVPFSYTFARWNIAWGWATWRRAWQHFDLELRRWPELRDTGFLADLMKDARAVKEYRRIFDELHDRPDEVHTWDQAWSFSCWSQSGFSVLPSTTLVGNIGFGSDATHFAAPPKDPRGRLSAEAMTFELTHPTCLIQDCAADDFIIRNYVIPPEPSLLGRLFMSLHRTVTKMLGARAGRILHGARGILVRTNLLVGGSCIALG